VSAYSKEYELGQRTLIDLLNAENQLFNALVSLVSTRGVAVFADYQLLAAMGKLTEYLKAPLLAEAEPLSMAPLGLFPTKLPPVLLRAPGPGPEPLSTFEPMPKTGPAWPIPVFPTPSTKQKVSDIQQLWPQYQAGVAAPVIANAETKTADAGNQHFPFATGAAGDTGYWPTTTLSFAPAAAGAAGAAFQNR
jgi:hypothetical protein